ncbi:MAG: DUF1272 domain-containing protein [Woeseia sp.]|nr:DUF1272 domain-containing protein [Woeseia sp.]MBT6211850.1 DUF1272 domain-containing protein [Woeseia sp.]
MQGRCQTIKSDRDLPPQSTDANIYTYECTFCSDCVENVLRNVCPNCGGGFTRRLVRPSIARRGIRRDCQGHTGGEPLARNLRRRANSQFLPP